MFNHFKKRMFISLSNFLKRYLIYIPFEQPSTENGNIVDKYSFHSKKRDNLCIFSHFDKGNIVDDYVVFYLQNLVMQGFDIVFISTAKGMATEEIDKIKSYCRDILIKENIGYDFGAWQTGIMYLEEEIDAYDSLLLCNDSVYAPIFPLNEMFDRMQGKYDFWGITDSYEVYHHIQSYFMVFNQKIVSSEVFKKIWKTYRVYKIKRNIILQYEIGLSRKLLKKGYIMGAYCPYNELKTTQVCNASHYYWKDLIGKLRCPALKVELLRDNPQNIDISTWKSVLENETPYKIDLIVNHLDRVNKKP